MEAKLKVGKIVGIKTGARVSRAEVMATNPDGTLVKLRIDGLDGGFIVRATDLVKPPRTTIWELKAMQPGVLNKKTFEIITQSGLQPKSPHEAQMEPYAPQVLFDARMSDNTGYAILTMAVPVKQCPTCGKLIQTLHYDTKLHQKTDLIPVPSGGYSTKYKRSLCKTCSEEDKSWRCDLCDKRKTLEELEYEGRQRVGLCKACFETVSAKRWYDAIDIIMDRESDYDY